MNHGDRPRTLEQVAADRRAWFDRGCPSPDGASSVEDDPELVMHLRIPSSRIQYVQRADGEHRVTYRNGQLVEDVLLKGAPHAR